MGLFSRKKTSPKISGSSITELEIVPLVKSAGKKFENDWNWPGKNSNS